MKKDEIMILNHQVGPTRKGRGCRCGLNRYHSRGKGRGRIFHLYENNENFHENESGRVIKGKQKMFAIDTARKKIGYVVVVHQIFSRSISRIKKKKRK